MVRHADAEGVVDLVQQVGWGLLVEILGGSRGAEAAQRLEVDGDERMAGLPFFDEGARAISGMARLGLCDRARRQWQLLPRILREDLFTKAMTSRGRRRV